MELASFLIFMLFTAGAGFWFGYSLGNTHIPQDELERINEEVFNEAKEEYIRYFHDRFDPQGIALSNVYAKRLQFENGELIKQNKKLTEELEKERKKNESIGSC